MYTYNLPNSILENLIALSQNDNATLNTFVNLYRNQAPAMIANIKLNASEKESIELKKAAHKFKGVCINLGFTPLNDICTDIETAGLQKNYVRVNALCTRLEELHTRLIPRMLNLSLH
jgi:HPt (histidine-containing phosphotransfer) domain-containing protein